METDKGREVARKEEGFLYKSEGLSSERQVSGHEQDFSPLALNGSDTLKGVDRYRGFIIQGPVRAQEVVVGDEECREGHRAIKVLETTAGAGVELVGAVEALDDLFESAVLGAFFIVVGQADNSAT